MTVTDPVDEARLSLLLTELRLPGVKHIWARFAERADKEGWPAARFLVALAEHELAERARRRTRAPQDRAPPHRGAPAAGQVSRQLRLRRRPALRKTVHRTVF
jgi:hypothetical protein